MHTFNDTQDHERNSNDTRRLIVLLVFLAIAAMPMVWLTVDDHAGERLLHLTKMASR